MSDRHVTTRERTELDVDVNERKELETDGGIFWVDTVPSFYSKRGKGTPILLLTDSSNTMLLRAN